MDVRVVTHRRLLMHFFPPKTEPFSHPRPPRFPTRRPDVATDDDGAGDPSGGKNQFNYSERAAQTYNAVMKVTAGVTSLH